MKYIKEFYSNFNYNRIAKTMKDYYKWGNVIINDIQDFENSLEKEPVDEDDYTMKFNQWLFNKHKNPPKFYSNDVDIRQRAGWYAKST
jgi:hypothetical protein